MRKLNNDLLAQLNWASRTLVGKKYINLKTQGLYVVKSIAVDTETLELRVIYSDGISINDWDRPLRMFIEKFREI